ncbi:hypothetical protein [Novosphingobium sp.]|uniref:hypothetical protein n=1 Tax=Novosphingobium sp. TaxID=1874826 RepID=UPI003BAD3321
MVGLIGLAIAALLSGSDRQARDFPNSPSYVGWPYDSGAARAQALLAFVRTGPASAIPYARRSVLSDPLSAQAVSILGRSQLYAQQLPQAHRTFEVSGQLGWRDTMTQIYWLDQALQGGDYKVGAERLDAILRQSPLYEDRDRLIAAVAETPQGRQALAERLKLAPTWANPLVSDVWDLPVDQVLQRVDLMRLTGKGVWSCADSEKISQRLIDLDQLDEAQSVWQLNCESSASLVYDGGFEHMDILKATTAFDWQLSNRSDTEISISQDTGGRRSLSLEVTGTTTVPILWQFVVLKPGRYTLSWRTPDTATAQANALQVSLTCRPDFSRAMTGRAVAGKPDEWRQDFVIDNECRGHQLIFWLAPHAPIHIDDVSLVAAGNAEAH